jgi:L-2-hydroxyglutarate oxidase LhgO
MLLYDYLKDRHIPHNKCGKLIVATGDQQQKSKLIHLKNQAMQNGVDDVKVLSKEDVQVLEPEVCCEGALWSPSTGVLDSHSLMVALLADAQLNDATLSLSASVDGGRTSNDDASGGNVVLHADGLHLKCETVVNCAGLYAHEVAHRIHQNDSETCKAHWTPPQQYFAKGNYFRLQQRKSQPFSHLVYPIPEPGGLGVHATIDWAGATTKFGPDVQWINPATALKDIDLNVNAARANTFYGAIRKYWPSLHDGALMPDYAGLRPKLYHPSFNNKTTTSGLVDFVIAEPKDHGVPGLYHLFGIESPGLTSSLSIANYIAERCTTNISLTKGGRRHGV